MTDPVNDVELLRAYVDVWWQAINDFTDLLEELPAEEWSTPTDLPGWDVKAVASHVAHLESILAGAPEETAEVGEPAHVTGFMGLYTEIGVVTRRDASPDAIINEIRSAATARHTALLADPPADPGGKPEPIFGGVGWDWRTLLRNRPLDVWMHEQDIRRAVDRPGGMDSPAARHTAEYLAESLGFVVAKRAGAEPGTTVVLELEGSDPFAFAVNDARRGERLASAPSSVDVTLRMDREAFIRLAGGRCEPEPGTYAVTGDDDLAGRIIGAMATTP
ncbi:maleylpyruvate isomerase family mycothiol-dependent enzyme [Nocardioides hankookensis]|uniref:Maleylpyruvate isomerase family mycothiol-dependent enzyme n=1 Tax=Nocardioides hankookensis TaxID=443157 RepID=A0ABW1LG24_9ACTN